MRDAVDAGVGVSAAVTEVRGRGLMIAVQLRSATAARVAKMLAQEAAVLCKDTRGHTIRFMPPLSPRRTCSSTRSSG